MRILILFSFYFLYFSLVCAGRTLPGYDRTRDPANELLQEEFLYKVKSKVSSDSHLNENVEYSLDLSFPTSTVPTHIAKDADGLDEDSLLLGDGGGGGGSFVTQEKIQDRRKAVFLTYPAPQIRIGYIQVTKSSKAGDERIFRGTLALISPKCAVTAAHNLVYEELQYKTPLFKFFNVYFGLIEGPSTPESTPGKRWNEFQYKCPVIAVKVHRKYLGDKDGKISIDKRYDIAVIQLGNPVSSEGLIYTSIGDYLGVSPLKEYTEHDYNLLDKKSVRIHGYPSYAHSGFTYRMYTGIGPIVGFEHEIGRDIQVGEIPYRLRYNVDTSHGQSGSPIFHDEDEGGRKIPTIIGIHTRGAEKGQKYNTGVLFNREIFEFLQDCIREFDPTYKINT